jgi:glycosyltransferase involved in cell wall biosynthesis
MRVSLIIPALNEAECIPPLLAEIPLGLVQEVIVVDNGSSDGTGEAASAAGALVVREERRGYGYACAAGVAASTGDVLVFMDGDGSFVPQEAAALLAPIQAGEADFVLGSRMLGGMTPGAMPPHQLFGNKLIARLLRLLYGLHLTDLGPFRAIRRELLLALEMREGTYGWPVEMMVKAARRRARTVERPVSYRPRFAGESKVGGAVVGTILATQRIFRVTFRYAWRQGRAISSP